MKKVPAKSHRLKQGGGLFVQLGNGEHQQIGESQPSFSLYSAVFAHPSAKSEICAVLLLKSVNFLAPTVSFFSN
ncbi:hypothetical protein SOVF_188330 [Spinacia oleracea]|nr:hypothetical protein SOVF_188330 [Spinacia oleracea]